MSDSAPVHVGTPDGRRRPEWWLAAAGWAAVIVFALVTLGPALIGGKSLFAGDLLTSVAPWAPQQQSVSGVNNPWLGDTIDAAAPYEMLVAQGVRHGTLTQWDPYTAGGQELGALPSIAAFSPLSLPWFVLPGWLAPAVCKLLELVVVAVGMSLLLRRWRFSPASWPLATLAFSASGFMIAWTGWQHTKVAAFIPLLFWAVDRAVVERLWRDVVAVGLVVAAMLFGGFPAVTGYALYAVAAFAVVRVLAERVPRRQVLRAGMLTVLGVGVGGGLAAWQMVPFVYQLTSSIDLDVRHQTSAQHLDLTALATALDPNALGGLRSWWGTSNPVEMLSYLGVVVVVLAFVALVLGRWARVARSVVPYTAAGAGVCLVLLYVGHAPLALAQKFPVFSDNPVGRVRVLLGFVVAVLAAAGLTALLRRPVKGTVADEVVVATSSYRRLLGWSAVALAVALVALAAYRTVRRSPDGVGASVRQLLLDGLPWLAAAVVGVVLLLAVRHPVARGLAVVVLLVGVTAPAALLAREWWTITPSSEFYPQTPVHQFLAEHLGEDRYISVGSTMMPGTAAAYGLRSATGHTFQTQQWQDMLTAVDPKAMVTSTYSTLLTYTHAAVTSPILDRLAVRYVVVPPGYPLLGVSDEVPGDGVVALPSDEPIDLGGVAGTLRGVAIDLSGQPGGGSASMTASLVSADGTEKASVSRVVTSLDAKQRVYFSLPDIATDAGDRMVLRVDPNGPATEVDARGGASGALAVAVYHPGTDGLKLEFTDGADVYERTTALDRIHWASRAVVEDSASARVQLLAGGSLPDDEVVLQSSGAGSGVVSGAGSGAAPTGDASVDVVTDAADTIAVDVDATGSGWLVVADSWTSGGWHATVDGAPAAVRVADHVGGAVAVPAGQHRVVFTYRSPGLRLGSAGTGATVLVLVLAIVLGVVRRRRRAGAPTVPADDPPAEEPQS